MDTKKLVSIQEICTNYEIPVSFVKALHDYELVEITRENNDIYLKITQLTDIEKMMRLHYDLDINLEGIDAIYNLLKQVEMLQAEILALKNKLRSY
jgi:hypothetical protein